MTTREPLVSVVIPTLNSSATLAECLRAIKSQTYKNVEIIVVDNCSKDDTREIAKAGGATVYVVGPERCAQINYGISKARGEFIYFTGSDLLPDRDYVEKAVARCLEGYDAVYTSVVAGGDHFWAKVKRLERSCYIGDDTLEAARFMRRSAFEKVCGIDSSLVIVDELDLQVKLNKAGFRTGRIGAVETHIGEPRTLDEIFRKNYYYGKYILRYVRKNPAHSFRQMAFVRPAYLRHIGVLAKDPIHLAAMILCRFVQYFAATLGMVSSILSAPGMGVSQGVKLEA